MGRNNGSSRGITQKSKVCIKEFKVTDKFKVMITKAFEETKRVLDIRANDLKAWTPAHEKEFVNIFGLSGETTITINYYLPGQKADVNNHLTALNREMTAYNFIKGGVDRMIAICNSLEIADRVDESINKVLYGNFSNQTDNPRGSARVSQRQTLHINLKDDKYRNKSQEEKLKAAYREGLTIDILQNFTCKGVSGKNSQVSTLCHELSHFLTIWDGEQYYGGLSSNDLGEGREFTNATELKNSHNPKVFENAYNIEKYFEIN